MKKTLLVVVLMLAAGVLFGCDTDSFKQNRETAHDEIKNYIDSMEKTDYSDENWAAIIMVQTNADSKINDAKSEVAIDDAVADALKEVDDIETLSGVSIKNARLSAIKAIDDVFKALNETDYSAATWLVIKGYVIAAEGSINKETKITTINATKDSVINQINSSSKK